MISRVDGSPAQAAIIGNHVGAIIGKGIEEVQMIILRV